MPVRQSWAGARREVRARHRGDLAPRCFAVVHGGCHRARCALSARVPPLDAWCLGLSWNRAAPALGRWLVKVVVTGSREFSERFVVDAMLEGLLVIVGTQGGLSLAHGACPTGTDFFADEWARDHRDGVTVKSYPAQWEHLGKAAGPARNKFMLKEHDPDLVLAFLKRGARNAGTKNCVEQDKRREASR